MRRSGEEPFHAKRAASTDTGVGQTWHFRRRKGIESTHLRQVDSESRWQKVRAGQGAGACRSSKEFMFLSQHEVRALDGSEQEDNVIMCCFQKTTLVFPTKRNQCS